MEGGALFDDEVEVEVSRVFYDDCAGSLLINIDLTEINHMNILIIQGISRRWQLNRMMQGITNTLDIKRNRPRLLLNIAQDVVVVLYFYSRGEGNLDGDLGVGSNNA